MCSENIIFLIVSKFIRARSVHFTLTLGQKKLIQQFIPFESVYLGSRLLIFRKLLSFHEEFSFEICCDKAIAMPNCVLIVKLILKDRRIF